MKLFKRLFNRQKAEVLIGGKTMDQLRKEFDIRTRLEKMRKYPERYRNGYQLGFE